jgi:hypothetical protein
LKKQNHHNPTDWHFIAMHMFLIKGNGQRGFKEEDISKMIKRMLYETGKKLFENGYHEIEWINFS